METSKIRAANTAKPVKKTAGSSIERKSARTGNVISFPCCLNGYIYFFDAGDTPSTTIGWLEPM
jgi:hypothetical protein